MLVALTLVAFAISSMTLPMLGYAEPKEQTSVEKFIEVTNRALEQVQKLIAKAEDRGTNVSTANRLVGEGQVLLTLAKQSFNGGNYTAAFEKAREAQSRFKEAIKAIAAASKEEEKEEVGKGLLTAIDRANESIQRLKRVLANINETSDNKVYLNWVKGNLTEAEGSLAKAKELIEAKPGNASDAAKLLAEAHRNLEEGFKALRQIGDWTMAWRAENFVKGIRKELEKMRGRLEESRLRSVEESLDRARLRILAGDKKGALDELKEARNLLHSLMKEAAKQNKPSGNNGKAKGK